MPAARTGNALGTGFCSSAPSAGASQELVGVPAGIAHGEITLARRDDDARPLDLHLDVAEVSVVGLVRRRVTEQVIVPLIALDPIESLPQIVGVVEHQAASSPRELAEPVVRILT